MNTASIIKGKLKFMRHENGEELLFDLTMEKPGAYNPDKDYHEAVNLVDTMPETAEELRKALAEWTDALPVPHYENGFTKNLYGFIENRWGFREAPLTQEIKESTK